ncbi:MAG: glycosyltransferase, partial [Sciscionella sp.]
PATAVVLGVDAQAELATDDATAQPRKPSPGPRGAPSAGRGRELVLLEVDRRRVLRQLLLAPPVWLLVLLGAIALLSNSGRLGLPLSGGALLPAQGLGATWSDYLATWHSAFGGSSSPAPAALAVLGVLGAPLFFCGGPAAVLSVALIGDAPLAGLLAYLASRRIAAPRWLRGLLSAAYALLPAATGAFAQGRVATIAVHLLLPAALSGILAVLYPRRARIAGSSAWLSAAVLSALAIAAIGAFSPLVMLALIVLMLLGFVGVPAAAGDGRRRVVALFVVVLLPLLLLLPWPAVLLTHPQLVLHGVGAGGAPVARASITQLVALRPGGAGSLPYLGVLIPLAALVAAILRPRRSMIPAAVLILLGCGVLALTELVPVAALSGGPVAVGWAGPALVLISAGLLAVVLVAGELTRATARGTPRLRPAVLRALAGVGVLAVLALGAGEFIAVGQGSVRPYDITRLAAPLRFELAKTHRSVLQVGDLPGQVRQVAARTPAFGDDDIVPAAGATARLAALRADLTSGSQQRITAALGRAAAAGVLFVELPDRAVAADITRQAGRLVSAARSTADGRPVLRVKIAAGSAVLISPALAHGAITGAAPPTSLGGQDITPV